MAGTAKWPKRPVLLVEENVAMRERLYDLLTRRGVPVLTVPSGEHTIAALKHERPGLIVADVKLSGTTGWHLVDQIRAFDTTLPIVLIGNSHQTTSRTSPERKKIQAVLPNDVSDHAFLTEVERWLNVPELTRTERWPGRILVVDDEGKIRTVLQEFLELHGFTVMTAESGEQALEQLRRCQPTVVLLDVKMPGMDGLLTLKKIKKQRPKTAVILITGLEEQDTMKEALALGADDYILKPFNFDYLETSLLSKILTGQTP